MSDQRTSRRLDRAELLARVDLAALLTEFLGPPRRQGRTPYWPCPAPAHGGQTGKTPPVTIRVRQGIPRWHCHSCGEGGTAVDLVMQVHQRDVGEAFRLLRDRADGAEPVSRRSPAAPARPEPPQPPLDRAALVAYTERCRQLLWTGMGGPGVTELNRRGLRPAVLRVNGVGYDPGPALVPRPAGLPRGGPAIVLPVLDGAGQPVYLQARYLTPVQGRRYDNPTGRAVGDSPRVAFLRTPEAPVNARVLMVCEGQLDALSAAQAGYAAAAVLGAGYPDERVAQRLVDHAAGRALLLAFDADPRGLDGAAKLAALLRSCDPAVRVVAVHPPHGDLNDWLTTARDRFDGQLRAAVAAAGAAAARADVDRPLSVVFDPTVRPPAGAALARLLADTDPPDPQVLTLPPPDGDPDVWLHRARAAIPALLAPDARPTGPLPRRSAVDPDPTRTDPWRLTLPSTPTPIRTGDAYSVQVFRYADGEQVPDDRPAASYDEGALLRVPADVVASEAAELGGRYSPSWLAVQIVEDLATPNPYIHLDEPYATLAGRWQAAGLLPLRHGDVAAVTAPDGRIAVLHRAMEGWQSLAASPSHDGPARSPDRRTPDHAPPEPADYQVRVLHPVPSQAIQATLASYVSGPPATDFDHVHTVTLPAPLVQAELATRRADGQTADPAQVAAELAFEVGNLTPDEVRPELAAQARDYRAAGLRSMSMGDLALVTTPEGTTAPLLCASGGWTPMEHTPEHGPPGHNPAPAPTPDPDGRIAIPAGPAGLELL